MLLASDISLWTPPGNSLLGIHAGCHCFPPTYERGSLDFRYYVLALDVASNLLPWSSSATFTLQYICPVVELNNIYIAVHISPWTNNRVYPTIFKTIYSWSEHINKKVSHWWCALWTKWSLTFGCHEHFLPTKESSGGNKRKESSFVSWRFLCRLKLSFKSRLQTCLQCGRLCIHADPLYVFN